MNSRIINTSDGFKTVYLPGMDERYHSVNGAFTESNYVFLEKGYRFQTTKTPKVFEVGFGTGLNCLLTALESEKQYKKTTFYTIEKYPLKYELIKQLNYGALISEKARTIYKEIHRCGWNKPIQISNFFELIKLNRDLLSDSLEDVPNCDVIYFDAFGPDKQSEMWSPEIFQKIYNRTSQNGVFVTYSAKGLVRRQLASCGFKMERLPGPPGKNQMLRGIK